MPRKRLPIPEQKSKREPLCSTVERRASPPAGPVGRFATAARNEFAHRLLAWYDANARHLPWRQSKDPYRIWLSEIMLQQTRVAAVLEHYRLFLKKFPNIRKLAAAREATVLAAWSGLGYYRRARMLHAAARVIVREHEGKFPQDSTGLRSLPGIGRYTAAAIASIAFDEPVAVVDGNVERVASRLTGRNLSGEKTWSTAESLLDRSRPGDFNQAIMELGATVCLPRQPRCLLCPVSELCATRGELPAPSPATRQHKRMIHVGLATRNGSVLLVQRRPDESLMPGMWELPECLPILHAKPLATVRHSITVTDYTVNVMELIHPEQAPGQWIPRTRLATLPLTGLARKILKITRVSR
jgi:A/G-specific adenine glycosylase